MIGWITYTRRTLKYTTHAFRVIDTSEVKKTQRNMCIAYSSLSILQRDRRFVMFIYIYITNILLLSQS